MLVPYRKMHGTGNMILVLDRRDADGPPPSTEELRRIGDSQRGPGFDQLMWIGKSGDDNSVARYRVFNADGSEVEQCGNGVRCVAKHLAEELRGDNAEHEFTLQSPAGPVIACVRVDGNVAVSMGTPRFNPADIPFEAVETLPHYDLDIDGQSISISVVSMGNPHAVLEVGNVDEQPVARIGTAIENHPRFPEKTNVGFMHIVDRGRIDLRVHERGVGETAACGTGACAAVVSGQRQGRLDETVRVSLPGGEVVVSWRGGAAAVWLEGDAETLDEGLLDLKE